MKNNPVSRIAEALNMTIEMPRINGEPNPKALKLRDGIYPTLIFESGVNIGLFPGYMYEHNYRVWLSDTFTTPDDCVVIGLILTPVESRKQGCATAAMQAVCDAADELGITLQLQAEPQKQFGGLPPTSSRLSKWYAKFGFARGLVMTRKPKQLAAV